MLLVITGHCDLYLTGWFSGFSMLSNMYQLPLFFFISGYFAYSSKLSGGNMDAVSGAVRKRIRMVLWPTLVMLTMYYCCFLSGDYSIADIASDQYKGGYWFTIVAVEIFVLALPFILLLNSGMLRLRWACAIIAVAMVVFAKAGNALSDLLWTHDFIGWLSLHFVFSYMPYFLLGIMMRLLLPMLVVRVNTLRLPLVTAVICLVALCYMPTLRYGAFDWRVMPLLCVLVVSLLLTFRGFRGTLNTSTAMGRVLSVIGRNTLPIYLLHYFILSLLTLAVGDAFVGVNSGGAVWLFPITVAVAVAVALCCIGADRLMATIRIRKYIFPGRG